ncbi:hypothetical protein FQN54_007861 [Arachnomyces sp. PD_36]|nr:hypothetical protein FQN54_007861 [Arachnomyces sp. PD_36]
MTGNSNPQPVPTRPANQQLPVRDIRSPPPQHHGSASPPSKRDLTSWWKQFKRNAKKEEDKAVHNPGIFGVPLNVSIKYANVAISLTDDKGDSFIYGYVPIVVAKCGVYLKEKATDVEGIFRLNGSAKRIKDLQEVFNSPDRYGKGLDWTGYTVHDAANILRRYLNQLPEPIVPLDFYDRFRDPLRGHHAKTEGDSEAQPSEPADFDHKNAVATYQKLIKDLPSLNRQLLLYILDLLAVFSSKSEQNRMTSANLAAIFQPGLLSHPSHDMAPEEYRLSQDVLIFLIENQDNFLFGMTGTAADEQTVKELEAGTIRPPTSRSTIKRSASNASAGADSLRKYENIRRNVSVSSKNSKNSGNVPSPGTPSSAMGVQRSNTVPSKRSVGVPSPRFDKSGGTATTPTSNALAPPTQSYGSVQSGSQTPPKPDPAASTHAADSSSFASTPISAYPPQSNTQPTTENTGSTSGPLSPEETTASAQTSQTRVASPPPMITPTKERKLSSFFTKSPPPGEHERKEVRQPNRLRKRQRIPGSASESAQSSTHSLPGSNVDLTAPSASHTWGRSETGNSSNLDCSQTSTPKVSNTVPYGEDGTPQPNRDSKVPLSGASNGQPSSDNTLKVNRSRTPSLHSRSSVTDQSDFDQLDDAAKAEKKENRRSWRFHRRSKKSSDQFALALATSPPQIGTNPGAEFSSSSVGSSSRPTKSLTNDSLQPGTDTSGSGLAISMVPQDSDMSSNQHTTPSTPKEPIAPMTEPEKKSFFGKFKARVAQVKEGVKEWDDKERAKSPPPRSEADKTVSAPNLPVSKENQSSRDVSVDLGRDSRAANHEPAATAPAAVPSPAPTPTSAPAASHPVIHEELPEAPPAEPVPQPEPKSDTIPEEPAESTAEQEQTPLVSVTPAVTSTEVEPPSSPPSIVVEATTSTAQEATDSALVPQVQNAS